MQSPDVVAVINTSPDTVDLLKDALEQAGMIVSTGYMVGRDEKIYEVVGKADDLNAIVRATREAVRARPTA